MVTVSVQKAGYGFEGRQIAAMAVLGEIERDIMVDILRHTVACALTFTW